MLDTVVGWLRAEGWPVSVRSDGEFEEVATKVQTEAGIWICVGRIDAPRRFAFYSVCPVTIPEDRRAAAAEFAARVNSRLLVGTLEVDLDTGETRVRTGIDVEGTELPETLARNVILANVQVMDAYAPALLELVEGTRD
jgi:hypothetical protein